MENKMPSVGRQAATMPMAISQKDQTPNQTAVSEARLVGGEETVLADVVHRYRRI